MSYQMKYKYGIQLSILAQPQQLSQLEPELGTAQPQLVVFFPVSKMDKKYNMATNCQSIDLFGQYDASI